MQSRQRVLYSVVLLYCIVALLPLFVMFAESLFAGGRFTLKAYRELFSSPREWQLLGNSLKLALTVSLTTLAAGSAVGLLLSRFDLPARRFLMLLFISPLLVPPYIWAVGWADLLAPGGMLAGLMEPAALKALNDLLFGFYGSAFILFCVYLPIPMLLTILLLKSVNPHFEEAGMLVTGWGGVLKSITLPLIAPGLLLGAALVFLLTFGEVTVPGFLRYRVYAVESFTSFSAFYDFSAATAYAVPMLAVTLFLILFEEPFVKRGVSRLGFVYALQKRELISPGRAGVPVLLLLISAATVVVVVPFAALLVQSGGVEVYFEAFSRGGDSMVRSLLYGVFAATLLALFGFLTGYMVHTGSTGCGRFMDSSTLFLFALPSTVTGVGLISLWNTPWTGFIYSTPLIVVMGFLAKYLVLPSRITAAQLTLIPDSMEEAAQVAGAGWIERMVYIVVPLAIRAIAVGWLAAYIFVIRDTSVAMLLYPPGYDTLSVRIFTLMANGTPELIAALCVVMALMSLIPAAAVAFFIKRSEV